MDLSKHLENAADAVKRRNYAFAVKLYSQLLALQPDLGEARAGLRTALFKKVEQKPSSKLVALLGGGAHLLLGGLSRALGKHASAARSYERYLALDPTAEGANLKLGDSLERAGFGKSALAVYRAYAEHEPRCLEASRRAGALLYAAGDHGAALAMYEQALKVDPRDQESLKARKNLAAEGALKTSGIEEAKAARELIKDKQAQAKLEKADRRQLSEADIDAELDDVERRLGENPDDVAALVRAAELHTMRDDRRSALDALERVLELDPERHDAADRAGVLRLELQEQRVQEARARGDEDAADRAQAALDEARVAETRRRVERHPTDFGLRFELGAALYAAGDVDGAIAELQQAVKDPRRKTEAHFVLGKAFRSKELGDLAIGQLEKALGSSRAGDTLHKDVLYELGGVAEELGRAGDALGYFSRILEQDIGFRDVADKVQRLKSSAG